MQNRPGGDAATAARARRACSAASAASARGFSLIDVLIAAVIVLLTALMGVAYVLRSAHEVDWSRDRSFARQKALSILAELQAHVDRTGADAAALEAFDDGTAIVPNLSIVEDLGNPGQLLPPQSPLSGNVHENGIWRWGRQIEVRLFPSTSDRDLRVVRVRMFRRVDGEAAPGTRIAEVSALIRSVSARYAPTQVYDVYLLALENVPGWWAPHDAVRPIVEAALADLESRNRGVSFRTHWITRLGYGRDEEYAPYTNEQRSSTESTPWAYVYPGRLPASAAAPRYYVPGAIDARVNRDGVAAPEFTGAWSTANPAPYALADMHNHCMRHPDAAARHAGRQAASAADEPPTWRLLLEGMVAQPETYRNAIVVNLHGALLPMPPVRNVSDPAKDPAARPGWRVVTHPERLRPARVEGSDTQSHAPRFRVHAWKAESYDSEVVTTQREPLADSNGNGVHDPGEMFVDWNGNGAWDAGLPISIVLDGGDFSATPNAASNPSLRVLRLPGGVDADGNGTPDAYRAWEAAARFPEVHADVNGDGRRQTAEPWLDLDGNGIRDPGDPHQELDGDGTWTATSEFYVDGNGNGRHDRALPAEAFTDTNGNGRWDAAEPFHDANGDGKWTAPASAPTTWVPWDPHGALSLSSYIATYGEPFLDVNGDHAWNDAESFDDLDGDGVCGGGPARGEMWYEIEHDATNDRTVLRLHATPLEAPQVGNQGLPTAARLYGMAYVPCPTPASASAADRFGRNLATAGTFPKNTARWVIEMPLASLRQVFASASGANDGDAEDRRLAVHTRLGRDLTTGWAWGTPNAPQNLSSTYAYWFGAVADVPYSERFQFQGDPRHSPYADTDATGTSGAHGYNWYFDDFTDGSHDARPKWLAFDGARLRDGWLARGGGHDVPRFLGWLREACARSGAVFTSLSGQSFSYLSLGGDVGGDATTGFASGVPLDGTPFGSGSTTSENTLADGGSIRFVRSNDGTTSTCWWSKPWLGELFQDSVYTTQWQPFGNLVAAADDAAGHYRLVGRGALGAAQQPPGTTLVDLGSRLGLEGSTSFFNVGSASATFHHQVVSGQSGTLVGDGTQLASNYGLPLPDTAVISRPFGLATSGGVGDEFAHTDTYPRCSALLLEPFYSHPNGQTGSGVVHLGPCGTDAGGAFVVLSGLDASVGAPLLARYDLLAALHGLFAAGVPTTPDRAMPVPRVILEAPTATTRLDDPESITVRWSTTWRRWDGRPYTEAYDEGFAETWTDVVHVLLYSTDDGATWRNMRDDSSAQPGVLPRLPSGDVDTTRTLTNHAHSGDESWTWTTPASQFPARTYLVRVEAHRRTAQPHYAHHMESIHVER